MRNFAVGSMNLQLDSSSAGAHTKYETEINMLDLLANVLVPEKFNDLEELLKVEILLASNNIDHVVKAVLLMLENRIVST